MIYTNKAFWAETVERAIKSGAQGALLGWGTDAFTNVGEIVSTVQAVGFAALFMFILSILTSIASAGVGEKGTPSLVSVQKAPDVTTNENDKLSEEDA